jgi:hypothetical protein
VVERNYETVPKLKLGFKKWNLHAMHEKYKPDGNAFKKIKKYVMDFT